MSRDNMVSSNGGSKYGNNSAKSPQQLREMAEENVLYSGRVNDMINQALAYYEKYVSDRKHCLYELSFVNFCHAKILLDKIIPQHDDFPAWEKKQGPFYAAYVQLKDIIDGNEDISQLEGYLESVYQHHQHKTQVQTSPQPDQNQKPNGKPFKVPRKPVGSDSSGSTTPDHQPADPLAARYEKLRGPRPFPEAQQNTVIKSNRLSTSSMHLNGSVTKTETDSHEKPTSISDPREPSTAPANRLSPALPSATSAPPSPPKQPKIIFPKTTVINAETLYYYLHNVPESILLLDIRERRCFEAGHIAAPHVACIEPVTIQPGKTENDLEDSLVLSPDGERYDFNRRNEFELVVYYDTSSETNTADNYKDQSDDQAAALRMLVTLVYKYGFSKPLKREPCLLVGGFKTWIEDIGPSAIEPPGGKLIMPSGSPVQQHATLHSSITNYESSGTSPPLSRDVNEYFKQDRSNRYDFSPPKSTSASALASYTQLQNGSHTQYHQHYPNNQYPQKQYSSHSVNNSHTSLAPMKIPLPSSSSISSALQKTTPSPPKYPPPQQPLHAPSTQYSYSNHSYYPSYPNQPQYQNQPGSFPTPTPQQIAQIAKEFTTGLRNLGNTCYMNSIIQCIAATPSFAIPFVDGSYVKYVNVNSRLGYKGVLAKTFADLVSTMFRPDVTAVGPTALKHLAGRIRSAFSGTDQQDCQEFLTFLIDGLHEELNASGHKERLKALTEDEERRREELSVRQASAIEWERYLKSDYSLVVDTFQGQYQSKLQCLECGFTSTTYNAFSSLSLPIPLGYQNVSLKDCFDLFTQSEALDGDNAWFCARCQKPRRSVKTMRISRLPQVLVIHLKRFQHYNRSNSSKLETFVSYPHQLDLTDYWPPYTKDDEKQMARMQIPNRGRQKAPFKYALYGVANHFGTLKGGHYTAYVNKGSRHGWCYFDDTKISANVAPSQVVNQHAYVLFYYRQ